MGRTSDYGDQYLCIRLKNNEDIYVYADQADIVDGAIVLSNKTGRKNLMIAPGQWESCYLVSRSDSSPLAIHSWARSDPRAIGNGSGRRSDRTLHRLTRPTTVPG